MRKLLQAATLLLLFPAAADAQTGPEAVSQFLQNYCIRCHGPDEEKGDRVLHNIDLTSPKSSEALQDILDQLNLGEMPPDKKGVDQPKDEEIEQMTTWLTETLVGWETAAAGSETVIRRLNRREYRNSMRDLLGLGELTIDPTQDFPADESDHGFTNIGEALNLSDAHLEHYLDAASQYLEMAFHFGEVPGQAKTTRIRPEQWGQPSREDRTPWMYRLHTADYLDIGAGAKNLAQHFDLGTYPKRFANHGGIQVPGYYRIKVTAEAIRRLTHPYDPKMIPVDLTPPMQLSLWVARDRDGLAAGGSNLRQKLGLWDLRDQEKDSFEVTVWLDKGAIPFLNWDNGPGPSDYWMRDIAAKYHTDIEFRGKEGAHAWHIIGKDLVKGRILSDVWRGPVMRVHDFAFTGPLAETWNSSAQQEFFGGEHMPWEIDISQALLKFCERAFRRPVTAEEIQPYLAIVKAQFNQGRPRRDAILTAFKAVLVSPDFLYLREDRELTSYQLASRLSYTLWSSLPDRQLLNLAKSGDLSKPEILEAETLRMIADPKSAAFVEGFCDSWLRMDKLGSMPPDNVKFGEYYWFGLEESFRAETHEFVAHMLESNRPTRAFLNSPWTYLNQDLARHYGIGGVIGSEFRRVDLPKGSQRGGLLGQGSILTLTANGVDTSPIVRGVWVLETLLGTPPSPPPPDVEPLDPDTRGATTIRERLEKHRSIEACANCHEKIDPWGFPLEYFDAVGGFRESYHKNRRWVNIARKTQFVVGPQIDGSAHLASGETFADIRGLRQQLVQRKDQFSKHLTRQLLTYATGRHMTFRDEPEIHQIAETENFQDLLLAVLQSEIFRRR